MVLTIGSRVFADAQIQGVTLHPVVGAYELRFGLLITASAAPDDEHYRALIDGARVGIGTDGGQRDDLGFARPDRRLEILTRAHLDRTTPALSLPLQPGQLAAIEELRDGGDLRFDLEVTGTGSGPTGVGPVHDVLRCHVPRSGWIEELRTATACDILLLEVPLPFPEPSDRWRRVSEELRRAEGQLRDGDYLGCVSACRAVVEELGCEAYGGVRWDRPFLEALSSGRREMSKSEREGAMLAALRHYTHQAHHGRSAGGETDYSRADARHVLALAASFAAHCRSG